MKLLLFTAAALIASPVFAQDMATPAAPMTADAPAAPGTTGGYGPTAPALSGPVTPGATIVYVQAPTPDQAYPAPAPLPSYPLCKRGQTDNCVQRGGR